MLASQYMHSLFLTPPPSHSGTLLLHGLEFEAKHIDYRAVEEINLLVRVEYFAERTSWIIFFIHQHFSFPLLVSCLLSPSRPLAGAPSESGRVLRGWHPL